jgi:hypothetical protein
VIRALALVAVIAWTGIARADDKRAEQQANEANLESNAPRAGVTFSAAIGGGLGLGHVATAQDVITFELTGSSLLHEPMPGDLRHNDFADLMAGALHYSSGSLWVRGAGGLVLYTVDDPGKSKSPHPGGGGLVGLGVDLARWHYLVLGLEAFGVGAIVSTKGLMVTSGICLGLTYY